jgi:hypothetical protein
LFIIYVLIRGFRYGYAVTPRQLQDYATKLSEHSSKRPVADMDVLSKIKLNLSQQYCDAATHNANINYRRRNLILFAMKLTAIAFICFVLTLPAYFVGKLHDSAKPTEVIISKPIKITP